MEGVVGTGLADTITGSGSNDILRGGGGNDTLNGAGGSGDLYDLSDATAALIFTIVQSASNTAFSAAGLGTDNYSNMEGIVGSAFADTITGSGSADILRSGGGNDTINGSGGNDRIEGGNGADSLTGSSGNDTFVFNTALNAVDTITDFVTGVDKIELSSAIFGPLTAASPLSAANFVSGAGAVSADGNDYVIFDTGTGSLYFDADGNGAAARILIANLSTGTLTSTDLFVV